MIEALGPRIREIRNAKGLTLDNVADHLGVSRSWVSQVEKAQTIPSLARLVQIAEALEIQIGELFGGQ